MSGPPQPIRITFPVREWPRLRDLGMDALDLWVRLYDLAVRGGVYDQEVPVEVETSRHFSALIDAGYIILTDGEGNASPAGTHFRHRAYDEAREQQRSQASAAGKKSAAARAKKYGSAQPDRWGKRSSSERPSERPNAVRTPNASERSEHNGDGGEASGPSGLRLRSRGRADEGSASAPDAKDVDPDVRTMEDLRARMGWDPSDDA